MNRASHIILSSDWACNSALLDYRQPADKVSMIEFGANIDEKNIRELHRNYTGELHLLFLGVDWIRKGGDIAVSACRYLNEQGIKATLHIVGVHQLDETIQSLPYIDFIGFLNKNIPHDYNKLITVIEQCHCMLLPTVAECAGIAFCESSAYGLPTFSHVTGGVENYVVNGVNGYLLPLGSTGKDFGQKIMECWRSGEIEQMSATSRKLYEQRLNWKEWQSKVEEIVARLLSETSKA